MVSNSPNLFKNQIAGKKLRKIIKELKTSELLTKFVRKWFKIRFIT